jgi:hypothetical protein
MPGVVTLAIPIGPVDGANTDTKNDSRYTSMSDFITS